MWKAELRPFKKGNSSDLTGFDEEAGIFAGGEGGKLIAAELQADCES